MAWASGLATIKAPACAIVGIRGVNLSFTLCQSRMTLLRIGDPQRSRLISCLPFACRCHRDRSDPTHAPPSVQSPLPVLVRSARDSLRSVDHCTLAKPGTDSMTQLPTLTDEALLDRLQ